MPEAVIVSTARSPIGRARKGSLISMRSDELATQMIEAALAKVPGLDPAELDDLILGCAQPAGEQGYNLARVVAVRLGLDGVPGVTVNRYCASSAQAIRMAFHAIRAGEGHAFVAAGAEAVSHYDIGKSDGAPGSHNPFFADAEEITKGRAVDERPWIDPRTLGLVPDAYIAMGETAENVAQAWGVSRERQDEWSVRSHAKALHARETGFWDRDITPVTLADGTIVTQDDGPRAGTTLEKLTALQPVFRAGGTVTAGNCCPLNDGAAAVIVMSDTRAQELGLTPIARVVASAASGVSPEVMGLGPIEASGRALANAGLGVDDIDLWEINEAFAAQVLPSMDAIGMDPERVNVHGGAIALGHPYGQTGARIASTLINGLHETDGHYGVETMCTAGGQGFAIVFERL
jgi:acetyl-CoA C-acetyltransferase